jgi:hypothetical protein
MSLDIAALDTPAAQVEANARRIARQQLVPEQALDMDPAHAWWSTHTPATTPAVDDDYPGWAERIAAIQKLNDEKCKEAAS